MDRVRIAFLHYSRVSDRFVVRLIAWSYRAQSKRQEHKMVGQNMIQAATHTHTYTHTHTPSWPVCTSVGPGFLLCRYQPTFLILTVLHLVDTKHQCCSFPWTLSGPRTLERS